MSFLEFNIPHEDNYLADLYYSVIRILDVSFLDMYTQ